MLPATPQITTYIDDYLCLATPSNNFSFSLQKLSLPYYVSDKLDLPSLDWPLLSIINAHIHFSYYFSRKTKTKTYRIIVTNCDVLFQ